MIDFLTTWTEDNVRLPGIHYPVDNKKTCVLFIHGMAGLYFENPYAQKLGEDLQRQGFGFMYSHNRGYSHINELSVRPHKDSKTETVQQFGVIFERFADCENDIAAWLVEVRRLGYKEIILCGHSLGCNKVIYYMHRHSESNVVGVILASPPDMVGLVELSKYQPNHSELLDEARQAVLDNNSRKILSGKIWDSHFLSAQTYLDLFEQGGPADNIPVLHNPEHFIELESVAVPMLCIYGERDDVAIRTLEEDMDLIEQKAVNAKSFSKAWVKDGDHCYTHQELQFAKIIKDWMVNL